jgi:hypothetical protein
MVIGHYDQALELVRADIDRLEPGRGTRSAAFLSLYGMLFLMGAVVAARASNRAAASDLLDEGQRVARQLGYDGNERFTAFGPINVHLHRVAALLDLGDGAGAVSAARHVTTDGLSRLPKERRANYYLDVARGHKISGHRDDAVGTLLTADRLFPDELRCRPLALDLVEDLRRSSVGAHSTQLHKLAARIGLADGSTVRRKFESCRGTPRDLRKPAPDLEVSRSGPVLDVRLSRHLTYRLSSTSTECPAHSATWAAGTHR